MGAMTIRDCRLLSPAIIAITFDCVDSGEHYINLIMSGNALIVANFVNKECYDKFVNSVPSLKAGTPGFQRFIDGITNICELPKYRHMPIISPSVIDNDIVIEFVLEDEEQGRTYCIFGVNPITRNNKWTTLKFDR